MSSLPACSWMPVLLTAYLIQIPPTDAVSEQCTESCLGSTATELYSKGISRNSAEISCQSHPSDTVWLRDGEVQGASRINCSVNGDRIRLEADTRPENCSIRINVNFQQKPNAKCILNETCLLSTTAGPLPNPPDDSLTAPSPETPADSLVAVRRPVPSAVSLQEIIAMIFFLVFVFYIIYKIFNWAEDHTQEFSSV